MIRNRVLFRFFVLLMMLIPLSTQAIDRFIAEDFTNGWGSSNVGPAIQATGGNGVVFCGDKQGNVYLGGARGYQFVDIITPDSVRHHLAGTGEMGYRDGPAKIARFRMGVCAGEYGNAFSICCGPDGSIYISDNGNYRVRKIYKSGDSWMVSTVLGGGTVSSLSVGQSAAAKTFQLPGAFQAAVNKKGCIVIATDWNGCYMVNAAGDSITRLANFAAANSGLRQIPPGTSGGSLQRGVADTVGNVYFGTRSGNRIFRVDSNGVVEHIGLAGENKLGLPDTLPLFRGFDTMTGIAVSPDGTCVYVCGGDEYDIARIPTDFVTFTSTLAQNGYFRKATVQSLEPNFMTSTVGALPPEGTLKLLEVCHIYGADISGSLYGSQYGWVCNGIKIDGKTPHASIFRLHRVEE